MLKFPIEKYYASQKCKQSLLYLILNTHHKDEVEDEYEIFDESRTTRQHCETVCCC